jgi:hypothetical protein
VNRLKMKLKYITLVALLVPSFQNCSPYHAGSAPSTSSSSALSTSGGPIGYDVLKATVIDRKCIGCHSGSQSPNLSSHATVMASANMVVVGNPQASTLYRRVADGSMPPGSWLSTAEIKAVNDWIQQGALAVTPAAPSGGTATGGGSVPNSPPVPTAPVQPTFTNVNARIFQPYCVSCHGGGQTLAGVNVNSHALALRTCVSAGSSSRSRCYTEIVNGSMPPNGTIPDADVQMLRAWIDAGALNN